MHVLQIAGVLLFASSLAYMAMALAALGRWREVSDVSGETPPVTVLVPAHGASPRLAECLGSVCDQDYPDFHVVFGLHDRDDGARPVIERVMGQRPGRDLRLVADSRRLGANPKNCTLANLMPWVRHGVIAVIDSDVPAPPHLLRALVAELSRPGVGAATCPYRGAPEPGWPARLGALAINDWFIPSVLVDAGRRELDLTYGAATAVRVEALEAVGGFAAMASAVAQDYVLGNRLRRAGWQVRLAPLTVPTVVAESRLGSLAARELRWMRTIRAVRPRDHALMVVTFPLLPLLLLGLPSWPWPALAAAVAVHLGGRAALHAMLRRRIPLPPAEPWLLPVRETLTALVWAASFLGRRVRWGDAVLVTGGGQSMRVEEDSGT